MNLDISSTFDSVKDGTKEVAELAHDKTSAFHEKYVSKVVPDCGKYGDAVRFVAEMAPGVAEYNAIREGDWMAFAISAGLDVAAVAAGAITLGAGYGAVKGGTAAAKAGVKVAAKEIAEAGAKKAVKEVAEVGAEKVVKEVAEAGVEKAVKEVAEAGAGKIVKEMAEAGVEKAAKEAVEAGAEKAVKETVETGAKKAVKEAAEAGVEKASKEAAEAGVEKTIKETSESGLEKAALVVKNKMDGIAREEKVLEDLAKKYGKDNVLREQYIRDKFGKIIQDTAEEGGGRRLDFVVKQGKKIIKSFEVTSETADKTLQMAKESRILEHAKEIGGAFIKDINTGELLEFAEDVVTEIVRVKL